MVTLKNIIIGIVKIFGFLSLSFPFPKHSHLNYKLNYSLYQPALDSVPQVQPLHVKKVPESQQTCRHSILFDKQQRKMQHSQPQQFVPFAGPAKIISSPGNDFTGITAILNRILSDKGFGGNFCIHASRLT